MPKPKKTVRVSDLQRVLASWDERVDFCAKEKQNYRRSSHAWREWEARQSAVQRCKDELRDVIES